MNSLVLTEKELLTAVVFGDTFALYDERSFDEFVTPLSDRLRVNKISLDVFKGKHCLDAGCGGGRGSILMAQAGAREVVGVDMTPKNIETCRKRAQRKGFRNLSFEQHSLAKLPFDSESFDVVWCNGVLHHTRHPDKGLQEITRVLKPNGHLWLYLYGSGGVYWYTMDWIRQTLKNVDVRECIFLLRMKDTPVRRIAEWIDDWYCAYLRRYTHEDVQRRLTELGYAHTDLLSYGMTYDTSQRRLQASAREKALMGEGDLRYFCQKTKSSQSHQFPLPDPDGGKGSVYEESREVIHFGPFFEKIAQSMSKIEKRKKSKVLEAHRVILCSTIHHQLRSMLEQENLFDAQRFTRFLEDLNILLQEWNSSKTE